MPIQNEKIIVFKDGNPTELRYYEAEKLVARLGTILDTDGNFIGLRELDVAEVSPSSWFERNIFKKQPQKHVDILTVDFIGLINWINTIKTIKNIENIESIDLIDTITDITTIGTINNIKDAPFTRAKNRVRNGDFETGDSRHWYCSSGVTVTDITTPTDFVGRYYCTIPHDGYIDQWIEPINTNRIDSIRIYAKSLVGNDTFSVIIYYSDGTFDTESKNALSAGWTEFTVTPDANKYLVEISVSVDGANSRTICVDNIMILEKQVIDILPALVASNVALGLGESATYATIRVDTATSGQATLLAAQGAGVKIHVSGYQLQAKGDVEVSLRSASTDISPEWDLNAREGAVMTPVPKPLDYFATVANELLSINLDAAIRVTGNVQYWLGA